MPLLRPVRTCRRAEASPRTPTSTWLMRQLGREAGNLVPRHVYILDTSHFNKRIELYNGTPLQAFAAFMAFMAFIAAAGSTTALDFLALAAFIAFMAFIAATVSTTVLVFFALAAFMAFMAFMAAMP